MDKDVVNRLSRFKLTCKEEEGVILEQKDVIESKKECERSLVVKIWGGGEKEANYICIRNTFRLLWCSKSNLKMIEFGQNFY